MQEWRLQHADRGASFLEYGAVTLLVAAIAVTVLGMGLPGQISAMISDALACVGEQQEDCASGDGSGDQAAPGEEPEPPADTTPAPSPSDGYEDEVVTQTIEFTDEVIEGGGDTACLAHLCDHDEFQDTWGEMGDTTLEVSPALWEPDDGEAVVTDVFFGSGDDGPELAPEEGTPPDEVTDWWEGLDPGERAEVISEEPEHIRDLDGIPSDLRNDLNREFLDDEIDRMLEDEELTLDEVLNRGDEEVGSLELRELVDLQDTLVNGKDDGDVRYDGDEYFLLALDPDEERSIVSHGNPDTADNVSTLVPGTGIEWTAVNGQLGRADNLYQAAVAADEEAEHASIAWIGYDTPNQLGALGPRAARKGDPELRDFQSGLRATHEGDGSNNTVIGHSYGSTVIGHSVRGNNSLDADNLVFVGSPGIGVGLNRVEDLNFNGNNVHATRSDDDWIENAPRQLHGRNPASEEFGANSFDSDEGTEHSQYFDNPESNQSEHMGEIIAGQR